MLDSQITFEAARMNAGLTLKEVARRLNVNALCWAVQAVRMLCGCNQAVRLHRR